MTDPFAFDEDPLPRDRWGRALLVPLDGGERKPFTRASTLGNYISDSSALNIWEKRNIVVGMGRREDLCHLAGSLPPLNDATTRKENLTGPEKKADRDTKKTIDEIIDAAKEAAYGSWKARLGTATHSACEPGAVFDGMPERLVADANAFQSALAAAGMEILASEKFVVNDPLETAGSFDHLVRVPGFGPCVIDLKTGGIAGSELKFATQLAVYAHAVLYDVETDERTPLESLTGGEEINKQYAFLAHLPIGSAECSLYAVDLEVGMRAAKLATMVRTARSVKDICFPAATLWSPLLTAVQR